jgi:hypothetical protein
MKSGTIDNGGGSIKGGSLKFIKRNPPALTSSFFLGKLYLVVSI